jgi:eukaryotic-like serine/threonine-protein kinase
MSDCAKCHTPLPVDGRFCSNCGTPSGEMSHVCPTDPTDELRQRLARTLSGRYEITRLLGRGGMAVVFLAEDLALERQVAIKVLPPDMSHDTKLIPRFQQEAKTAAKLDHPNIIPIYRVESEAGLDYFVMKYVNGRSLEEVLEDGPLAIDLARRVLREAALALGHAHKRHIVHRDVKPANIMIEADGRVILTDFGISKAVQGASQLTGTGTIIGTPHYMAPEQAKGLEVDGRADQYALAIVGHQILTGKQPFDGSAHSILYKHVFEPPPPVLGMRPDVPREISVALERALSKDPEQRFATMEDLAAALGAERSSTRTVVSAPIKPLAAVASKTAKPTPRGNVVRRSLIIVGICAVAGGAAWAGLREPVEPSEPLPAVAPAPTPEVIVPPAEPVQPTPSASQPEQQQPRPVVPLAPGEEAVQAPAKLKPVKREIAYLTVASEPWGTLYLDNVEIGPTPVADHPMKSGRHQLRIEQEGYRTKIETIVVTGPNPIRRRYSLEPAGPL